MRGRKREAVGAKQEGWGVGKRVGRGGMMGEGGSRRKDGVCGEEEEGRRRQYRAL